VKTTEEFCCIGILLRKCPMPIADCDGCWYSNSLGAPTLVKIEVFHQIRLQRIELRDREPR
jgi:hypothetical protein